MDFDAADVVTLFDRVGIVAFAISGVEVGARRRLDIFGLLVMGVVTATGGGAIRDAAIGHVPLVIERADYLLWAGAASVFAIGLTWARKAVPRPLVAASDAVGLGAFAVAGAIAAIEADLALPGVLLLAVVTATGGGVVRDLLADRVPQVLRSEVNATAAAAGGLATWALEPVATGAAALAGLAVAAGIRLAGVWLDLNLPVPGRERRPRQGRLL